VLKDFNKLTCKPGDTQNWKSQVGYQDTTPYNNPDVQVVACGSARGRTVGQVSRIDVAKVRGTEITAANAGLSPHSNQWQVNLTLKRPGCRGLQHAHVAPVQHLLRRPGSPATRTRPRP